MEDYNYVMDKTIVQKKILFSEAIRGFLLHVDARRLAKSTRANYQLGLGLLMDYLGDRHICEITHNHIIDFFAARDVTKRTIQTYRIIFSTFWKWAAGENLCENIIQQVPQVKPERKIITGYSKTDVLAMLGCIDKTQFPERNKSIILLLLDTGIRASELCNLRIMDVDRKNSNIQVIHGKGDKTRTIPFSSDTAIALWRYENTRQNTYPDSWLFVSRDNLQMNRDSLRHMLQDVGERAGVKGVTVHRFRHTFALEFLRSGIRNNNVNPWALKLMLGHEDMETTQNYLEIARADIARSHEKNSPVGTWLNRENGNGK
jgi:site-specific recombinase XerD